MQTARYGGFSLRTDCNSCGQPVPLNGPWETAHCDACQKNLELPQGIWTVVLETLDEKHDSLVDGAGKSGTQDILGFQVHYSYRRADPRCEKCQTPFPTDRLAPGSARDFCCVACGDGASTIPAPQWLKKIVPTAAQIYSVDKGMAAAIAKGAGPPPEIQDAAKPVVMACPQCGGSLKLTAEATRILPCQFCNTDVYLPDELWKRLHPTRTVREWYVRFEGKTKTQLRGEERERAGMIEAANVAQRAEANARLAFDAAQRKAGEAAAFDNEIAGLVRTGYVFAGIVWFFMLLTIGWCLIASELNPAIAQIAEPVGFTLTGVSVLTLFITLYVASRPVKRRTNYDGNMMMFVVWFFMIFGLVMPAIGSIMCFVVAIQRFRGVLGGSTIKSGSGTKHYPKIKLTQGETYPLGVVYLAIALLWPAIMMGLGHLG